MLLQQAGQEETQEAAGEAIAVTGTYITESHCQAAMAGIEVVIGGGCRS